MRKTVLVLAVVIAFVGVLCALAQARQDDQVEKARDNINEIEKMLEHLSQEKKLTNKQRRLRISLKRVLSRLQDAVEDVKEEKRGLEKLNRQARDLLNQLEGVTFEAVEKAIEEKDYARAAEMLEKILEADPADTMAKQLLEKVLPQLDTTPYDDRVNKKNLEREGGSAETEAAVAAALQWLSCHQDKDGKWNQDGFAKNCDATKGIACTGPGHSEHYDVALTGLALMAYLGNGSTHQEGKYKENAKKGLDWLLSQQQADGRMSRRIVESWVYSHAIATLAICEALAMTGDKNLREPCQRAVTFTVKAQKPGSGWKYEPGSGMSDTSVTGWVVSALKAAQDADIAVPRAAFDGALSWFDRATNTAGKTGYMRPGDDGSVIRGKNEAFAKQPTMTAAAVHSRMLCGQGRDSGRVKKGIGILMSNLPVWNRPDFTKVDPYYWYHGTQALFHFGGTKWKRWNTAVKKALLENQCKGGCADGSWEPVGKWDVVGGRIGATALNCLTLEAYYRCGRSR